MHDETPAKGFGTYVSGLMGLAIVQCLLGALLGGTYRADQPHNSAIALRNGMSILTSLHYWLSALLIVLALGGIFYAFAFRRFGKPNSINYLCLLVVAGFAYFSQLSGNLLPGDIHDVRTFVVEGAIGSRAPIVGGLLRTMILGGQEFSSHTFELTYMAHMALVLVLFLPALINRWSRGAPFKFSREGWMLSAALLGLALVVSAAAKGPHGAAATSADYTSQDALVSWYTWPLHGSLVAFDKVGASYGWIGAMLIPGLLALLLVVAPFWGIGRRARTAQVVFFIMVVYFLGVTIAFGGQVAPLTGVQDLVTSSSVVADPGQIDEALFQKGAALFKDQGCNSCHGIDGAKAAAGPDLSTTWQKRDRAWLESFIAKPTSVKPSSTMPAYPDLKPDQLKAVAEFLVKKRG